jgi:hypothetical protein
MLILSSWTKAVIAVECLWEIAMVCRWQNWYYKFVEVMRRNATWECRLVLIDLVKLELLPNKTEEARFKVANDKDRETKKRGCFSAFLFFVKSLICRSFTFQSIPQSARSFLLCRITHYSNIILLSLPISWQYLCGNVEESVIREVGRRVCGGHRIRGERGKTKMRWWCSRLWRFILRVVHVTSCCC